MKIVRLSSMLMAFVFTASAIFLTLSVRAGNLGQNANSSTTATENTNAAAPSRKKTGRTRRQPAATASDSAAMPETPAAVPTEQTDLSGTYTGTFDCSDAGVSGETTLTITGNQFTTGDGKTGRITAATTQGYTGVAMQFGESTPATGTTPATIPTIVSMRAKKAGSRLTLTSVPGSGKVCSFTPAGSSRTARTRKTPRAATPAQPAAPAASGEPVTAPATAAEPVTPGAEAGPAPPATPSPSKRAKKKPGGTSN